MNSELRELIDRTYDEIYDLGSDKSLIFNDILGSGWNDIEYKGLPYTRKESDYVYATDEELIQGVEQLLPKLEWAVSVYRMVLDKWYK